MLEVVELYKSYEGQSLLAGVSFTVAAGETVCLLGPSGSGKSTLLRIVAGLEAPEGGQVRWEGQDLAEVPAYRRGFGLVFQDYALFPHLDVFENVAFGLRMQKLSPAEIGPAVERVLQLVHLSGFETRRVTDLSGGEQQRVALARALAPRPRLLMFDEPLGALDRNLREGLMDELRGILKTTGVPAIYVTHDQAEAFSLADRILLLHAGGICRSGTPAEIWEKPGSLWAARFLDAGNLLEGRLGPDGNVETPFGRLPVHCDHRHLPGDTLHLLVRPGRAERVPTADAEGHLRGRVTDVIFHQDRFKVVLDGSLYFYLDESAPLGKELALRLPPESIQCLE